MSTSQIDRTAASDAPRRAMIDSQLRPSGVTDARVLAAMGALPREDFVPAAARASAYIDRAIPLADGAYLAAPLVHALMLQEAAPLLADTALLVGEEGYLAALLRPMVGALTIASPAGDIPAGGFILALVDGAVPELPAALAAALADGGRLVTGLVERGVTRLATGRKSGGHIALLRLAEIGIPVLPALTPPPSWTF